MKGDMRVVIPVQELNLICGSDVLLAIISKGVDQVKLDVISAKSKKIQVDLSYFKHFGYAGPSKAWIKRAEHTVTLRA